LTMGPLETPIPLLQMGDKGGCPPLKFSIPLSPPSPRGIE